MPNLRVKVELFHYVRNHDRKPDTVVRRVMGLINYPYEEHVTEMRIAVGYRAGAVFLTLVNRSG